MSKFMSRIFSVKNDGQYTIIKFMGFAMYLYNKSHINKKRQILNKIIKHLKKTKVFHKESYNKLLRFDPEDYEKHFQFYLSKDISESYSNLIKGLDEKSVSLVSLIMYRFQKAPEHIFSNFEPTEYEKNEMNSIEENLNNQIVKCSHRVFAYKNYRLPFNVFDEKSFYFQNGICDLNLSATAAGGGGG
jgi:hypothetical protein